MKEKNSKGEVLCPKMGKQKNVEPSRDGAGDGAVQRLEMQ